MGFYGEIINTGESPFVFDRIYSSRYHMERSMAADGVYSNRYVLVSYDSSYSHNDFKRAYIKDEDRGSNQININLYKDSACIKPVKYKDFDEAVESVGDSLSSTLAEVYYITDGYTYTYYKCSGVDEGIALFDYYTEMNSLFYEAFRSEADTGSISLNIPLYLDSECANRIPNKESDSENGASIGDVFFVREEKSEISEKEQAQGIYSIYECTGYETEETNDPIFKLVTSFTGHYQDETLENYIFNQKLDHLYYGEAGGVHNYDKTVWQKVYIGDKEKYIKVASLNATFPKFNITIDPPQMTVSHPPYFDSDLGGQVENLHIQPQWGFRVAAATKQLSTRGATLNPLTGNYSNYIDTIRYKLIEYANNLLMARANRYNQLFDPENSSCAYENLKREISNILTSSPWSALEEIDIISNTINEYISLEESETSNFFKEKVLEYNTLDANYYGGFKNSTENIYYNRYYFIEYYKLNSLETDFFDGKITELIQEATSNNTLDGSEFETQINNFLNLIIAENAQFDNYHLGIYQKVYTEIRDILQNIFNFDFENRTSQNFNPEILQGVINNLQGYDDDILILTEETLEEVIENTLEELENLIEADKDIKSDADVIWNAVTPQGVSYNFDGYKWTTDVTATVPADIYYNKAGFDYTKTSKDESVEDAINITPTGFSQVYDSGNDIWVNTKYYKEDSIDTIEAPDIQELSIHLPSIGNTISDVWDIVYGAGDPENDYERKTNIAWDTTQSNRTRLIQNDPSSNSYINKSEDLATIAGAINTTQDLIGRIIVENVDGNTSINDLTSEQIEALSQDYIYYFSDEGRYYKIASYLDFEHPKANANIIDTKLDYENLVQTGYTSVDLMDPDNLDTNYYYEDIIDQAYRYSRYYSKTKNYVTFNAEQTRFQIDGFRVDTDKNLIKDSQYQIGETYYNVTLTEPKYLFIPGEFYVLDDSTNKYVAAQKFNPGEAYYLPQPSNEIGQNAETGEVIYDRIDFVKVYDYWNAQMNNSIICTEIDHVIDTDPNVIRENYVYECYIKYTDINNVPKILENCLSSINLTGEYYKHITGIPSWSIAANVVPEFDKKVYGVLKSDFNDNNRQAGYEAEKYYYTESNAYNNNIYDYKKDISAEGDSSRTYYMLNDITYIQPLVYETGKYYALLDDSYVLDSSGYSNGTAYYTHNKYYVTQKNDEAPSYEIGQVWDYNLSWTNYQNDIIGASLISENDLNRIYCFEEMSDFGRSYNTINGLILSLNKILGKKDSQERDLNTIYGALRRLNDEVRRLSLYDASLINNMTIVATRCYNQLRDLSSQLRDLQAQAAGTFGGLLTEGEALYYYPSLKDVSDIIGYDFSDINNKELVKVLYAYTPEIAADTQNYVEAETYNGVQYYYKKVGSELTLNLNGYEADYLDYHLDDSKYMGVRTSAPFTKGLPNLFDYNDENGKIRRNIIDEIKTKLPENVFKNVIGDTGADPTELGPDTVLKQLYDLKQFKKDMYDILYGTGSYGTTYVIENTQWKIKDNVLAHGVDFEIAFQHDGVNYNKIICDGNIFRYYNSNTQDSKQIYNSQLEKGWCYATEEDPKAEESRIITITDLSIVGSYDDDKFITLQEIADPISALVAITPEGQTPFTPDNQISVDVLNNYNASGILGRLAALDANLKALTEDNQKEIKDALEELRKKIKDNIGTTNSESGSDSSSGNSDDGNDPGITGNLNIDLIEMDQISEKYGFKLLDVTTSIFTTDSDSQIRKYEYNFTVSFTPTENISFSNQPLLKAEGVSFAGGGAIPLVDSKAPNSTLTLQAQIASNGIIYFNAVGTWKKLPPQDAYVFRFVGTASERVVDGETTLRQGSAKITFAPDKTNALTKYSSFTTEKIISYYPNPGAPSDGIEFPKNPTLTGCKFLGWVGLKNNKVATVKIGDPARLEKMIQMLEEYKEIFAAIDRTDRIVKEGEEPIDEDNPSSETNEIEEEEAKTISVSIEEIEKQINAERAAIEQGKVPVFFEKKDINSLNNFLPADNELFKEIYDADLNAFTIDTLYPIFQNDFPIEGVNPSSNPQNHSLSLNSTVPIIINGKLHTAKLGDTVKKFASNNSDTNLIAWTYETTKTVNKKKQKVTKAFLTSSKHVKTNNKKKQYVKKYYMKKSSPSALSKLTIIQAPCFVWKNTGKIKEHSLAYMVLKSPKAFKNNVYKKSKLF